MDAATGFVGGEDALGVEDEIFGDEFEVVEFIGVRGEFLEFGEGEGGVEFGVFEVDAGETEAVFDGFAEDETTEDGGGGDGIGGEVGHEVDAVDGDGLGDVLVGEVGVGKGDEFAFWDFGDVWGAWLGSRRVAKLRITPVIFVKDKAGLGKERVQMLVFEIAKVEDEFGVP